LPFSEQVIEAIKYLILGIIQGVTEVLPISSSGHVELAKVLLAMDRQEGLLFLILVNTGSLLAFLFFYSKDLWRILKDFIRHLKHPETREMSGPNYHYAWKLVVATIPAGIVGVLLSDLIDRMMIEYNILLSGVGLLFTATILYLIGYRRYRHGLPTLTYKEAGLIGLGQAIAILPGISRSGLTTAIGLKKGLSIDAALKFSFMMYIPISLGSILLYLKDIVVDGYALPGAEYAVYYLIAFLAAFVSTLVAFRFIFNIFRTNKLKYFSYYCFAMAFLSIVLFIVRQ
jgi:undecaprenyl-diphosphatase